jgi:hypothetical protein
VSCQWRRAAATSARRCSSACTVFYRQAQAIDRAPERAQRGRRGTGSRNSAGVASGYAAIDPTSRYSWWGSNARRRNLVCFRGAISPVSRRRCFTRSTHARLTEYFATPISPACQRPSRARHASANPSSRAPWHLQSEKGYYVQAENALLEREKCTRSDQAHRPVLGRVRIPETNPSNTKTAGRIRSE